MPITVNLQRWTPTHAIFLLTHYQFMGDAEMAEFMNQRFPRPASPWTRKQLERKRQRMGLVHTREQLQAIRHRNNQRQRYNTKPARQAYQQEAAQVTDKYIMSSCLGEPKSRHAWLKQNHGLLIELTRRSIIRKRAERINYAVQ